MRAEARANQHVRDERFQNNWVRLKIVLLWLAGAGIGALLVTWVLHLLGLTWLTPEQFVRLEGLVTGGILASTVVEQIKKQLR